MAWCASGMHPLLGCIFNPGKVCDLPGMRKLSQEQLFESYQIADRMLAGPESGGGLAGLAGTAGGQRQGPNRSIWTVNFADRGEH